MKKNAQKVNRKPKVKRKNFEFRVIAGDLKGKLIKAPDLGVTRPPLTRLRKSIFDFLNPHLEYAHYLDLFSGTGSYLFEAVSRGAKSATGVELEQKIVDAINSYSEKYEIAEKLKCINGDVFEMIKYFHSQKNKFDIIMIAPPQYKDFIKRTLTLLRQFPIVSEDHLILCQHDTSETKNLDFTEFEIIQSRKYGNTTFTVLKLK
ncbi:MAG: hypothetical protein DWP97_05285 [Calditrichaeota bacterium]|nr:MAG: hypothetical protein DWP97_05285 [Calditrichota bacterium]